MNAVYLWNIYSLTTRLAGLLVVMLAAQQARHTAASL
jgi:hypothetical protein